MIRASTLCLTLLLLAACGPAQPVKCTMANCSGCCSESGECLGPSSQSSMACGTSGAECRSCLPGQLCSSGRCEKDPNAVIELDAGNMTVDAGRPDAGMTTCGSLNTPCCTNNTCYLSLSCVRGACQMTVADAGVCGGLGQACCLGSMCSASGASCSNGVCQTPDAGPVDAGTQLKATGEACNADSQCADGACLQTRFDNGYCTKACTSSTECLPGSQCGTNPSGIGPTRVCLKQCSSPNTSPGGCRTGYVCEPNAGTSGVPVCFPSCTSNTQCGSAPTCDSRGFCCGANGFACCDGNSCAVGNSCMSGTCRTASPTGGGTGSTGGGSGATGGGSGSTGGGTGSVGGGAGSSGGGTATGNNRPHGSACADFLSCAGNTCIQNWPAGYCSNGNCSGSSCGSNASCSPYISSSTPYCLQNCTWDGSAGGCRAGYVCDRRLIPTNPSQAVCYPACNSGTECATGVCESGFCCGGSGFRCCSGTTPCASGTCQSDGYCG